MFSLLCFGLLLVGIHGINEIRPQQPHIEVFDVPGDPFSSLPKVNLDDKECNLQEYTKEYKKAIKEWQEKYQKLAKSNNAEVNAFFKQFIQEFAYRSYDASPLAQSSSIPTVLLIIVVFVASAIIMAIIWYFFPIAFWQFLLFTYRFLTVTPKQLIIFTSIVIFIISCWSHYTMRYEEAVARYTEKQKKFTGTECDPLTTWQWFTGGLLSFVTIKRDSPCYEYHLNMQQNVRHQVKLTKIVGEVFTEWITSGLFVIGEPIRAFCDSMFKDAPALMILPLTIILALVFLFIFIFLSVGTLKLFNAKIHSPLLGISFGSIESNTGANQLQYESQMRQLLDTVNDMNQRLEDNLQQQNNAIENKAMPAEIEGIRRRRSTDRETAGDAAN